MIPTIISNVFHHIFLKSSIRLREMFDRHLRFWAFWKAFTIFLSNLHYHIKRFSSIFIKLIHESRVILMIILDFEPFWAGVFDWFQTFLKKIHFFYQIYNNISNVFLRFFFKTIHEGIKMLIKIISFFCQIYTMISNVFFTFSQNHRWE